MALSTFFSSVNRRGQILDLLVFLANLFLLGPFTNYLQRLGQGFTANDDTSARKLALIILAAFLAYMFGAMIKRAPLHSRVGALPNPDYAGCLFIGWIALHLSLCIIGASLIAGVFDKAPKGIPLATVVLLSTLPTIFAIRVIFRPAKLATVSKWRKSWPMELFADILIVGAVILLTIIWDLWIAPIFMNTWADETMMEKLFAAAMAAGAFALFYVAPRFLFLIEDYDRRATWATIGLTLAPLVGRILFATPAHR
jgi:hypothetical protein